MSKAVAEIVSGFFLIVFAVVVWRASDGDPSKVVDWAVHVVNKTADAVGGLFHATGPASNAPATPHTAG